MSSSSSSHRTGNSSNNGRGRGAGRGGAGGGASHGRRPRRAADYTPAQVQLADPAQLQAAAQAAIERNQRQQEEAAAVANAADTDANGTASAGGGQEEAQEPDLCYICTEPVRYWMLGTCNHRTCHVCALRLRALYKKRECTFCKVSGGDRAARRYQDAKIRW